MPPYSALDALKLSDRKRAQELVPLVLQANLTASDRVLVVDTPNVIANRHWVCPLITAWFTCSFGAGLDLGLQLFLCPPTVKNFGITPVIGGIADTTAVIDTANRPVSLNEVLDPLLVWPDQAHCRGSAGAGAGEKGGIIVPSGWFIRAILNGLGTADGANWTRPFPPADAVLSLAAFYVEEPTEAGC